MFCRLRYIFCNSYYISSLMIAKAPSKCVYIPLQLLTKWTVKVNKNCSSFRMKHLRTSNLYEVIIFCTHHSFIRAINSSVLPVLFWNSFLNFQTFSFFSNLFARNFCNLSAKFFSCIYKLSLLN